MNHPLADQLRELADFIEKSPEILSEKGIVKELDRLSAGSNKVLDLLQSKSLGLTPEAEAVRGLLKNPGLFNSIKDIQTFAKTLLAKAPAKKSTATMESYTDDLVIMLAKKGQLRAAESMLHRQLSEPKLDFSRTDSDSLLVEIRKLGGMDDYTFKKESVRLLDKPELLIKMGEISGVIKPNRKKDPSSKSILNKLRKLGVTFHENRGV